MARFDFELGRELTDQEEAAQRAGETVLPAPVPAYVTRYQFLAAIRATNRAAALKTHIQGLPEAEQEAWLNRRLIFRGSAMVEAARVALGVSNAAVDSLFRAATEIED